MTNKPTLKPDLVELARLAKMATPGPWFVAETNDDGTTDVDTGRIHDWGPCHGCEHTDAAYIATVDPQTVLAMIDQISALQEENSQLRLLLVERAFAKAGMPTPPKNAQGTEDKA